MLKMGLPKEAAKHAMVRDQLDPSKSKETLHIHNILILCVFVSSSRS